MEAEEQRRIPRSSYGAFELAIAAKDVLITANRLVALARREKERAWEQVDRLGHEHVATREDITIREVTTTLVMAEGLAKFARREEKRAQEQVDRLDREHVAAIGTRTKMSPYSF